MKKDILKSTKAAVIFLLLVIVSGPGCNRESSDIDSVYMTSWSLEEHEGITFIHMVASNGIEASIPARPGYGSTIEEAEEILKAQNIFDHYALYDTMVARGIEMSQIRAADALCWDAHARTQGVPLHELIGTKRKSAIRYGDARWRDNDTPQSYAQKVKGIGLRAIKLHVPGAAKPQHYAPADRRLTVPQIVEYLKVVREVNPDLVLAYDPEPQVEAAESIDSARIIMEACDKYNYTWIEAPLPLDKKYWDDYRKLREEFDVIIQNEEKKITYDEFLEWVNSGAIDQICPAVYTHTDYGLTPSIKMIKWVQDHPEKNITINLHYTSIEHVHLAFTMTDEECPYFEAAHTGNFKEHFTKVNLYEKCIGPDGTAIAPEFPGIYDIPWLNERN